MYNQSNMDQFSIYKKWFWIGIVIGFLNGVAGMVYGIALFLEHNHKKEGLIIMAWSLAVFILALALISYLRSQGLLPQNF